MDDGEKVLSNAQDMSNDFQGSAAMDAFLDEFLKNTQTCTHTHTCNPPGPDAVHTHTCYHAHTQVFTSEDEDGAAGEKHKSALKSRRPSGNREAVRKYREKKKAHTAYLEEEVKKLRGINQQLIRKLQGQAILEAELLRLRTLLFELRGKIDIQLGIFPSNKGRSSTGFQEGDCKVLSTGIRCETTVPCLHPHVEPLVQDVNGGSTKTTLVDWGGGCEPAFVACQTTSDRQNWASVEANHESFTPNAMDTNGK